MISSENIVLVNQAFGLKEAHYAFHINTNTPICYPEFIIAFIIIQKCCPFEENKRGKKLQQTKTMSRVSQHTISSKY